MRNESIEFRKYDALGNDYLVVDPQHCDIRMTPETVRRLCDRHHGIGSDGIVLGPIVDGGRLGLRLFNPDGSECEKSGNGLRIFARSLIDAGYVTASTFTVRLEYSGHEIGIECVDGQPNVIKVAMGEYTLTGPSIPESIDGPSFVDQPLYVGNRDLRVSCIDLGNPHCVVVGGPVDEATARLLGPDICNYPGFPQRTNVQFCEVISRDRLRIEIWERGAGYTLASGSSSCAAVAACHELGLVDRRVTVNMPGGSVIVEIGIERSVFLTGPVRSVAAGEFAVDLRRSLISE